jgi:MFS family permease
MYLIDTKSKNNVHHKSKFKNWLTALTISLGGYFFFHVGIFNPMADPMATYTYNLSGKEKKDFVSRSNSFLLWGGAIGVLAIGSISDKLGRVKTLLYLEILSLITSGLFYLENIYLLYIARMLAGVICASNSTLGLITINEMYTSDIRGLAGLILYLIITVSILIAYFIPYLFDNDQEKLASNAKLILSYPGLLGILRLILLLAFYKLGNIDSPKYYYLKLR